MTGGVAARPVAASRARRLNPKLLVAGLVIVAAVAYLIYTATQSTAASYFVTVGELQQQAALNDGHRVRVGGNVKPGTIQKGGPGEPIRFEVTDGTAVMPVSYTGDLPDIFTDNVQVVVEGTYHANGTFEADTLLTKCPSKFEATKTASQ
ncbi:MAG: cytochrome c maturation protein CcmE [Thermomicrobiaceae bacterium]|nr:cytochrome c maturation protein CcmE [Thermomicrobiaceae bacterium]